jgi:hypothetical protein
MALIVEMQAVPARRPRARLKFKPDQKAVGTLGEVGGADHVAGAIDDRGFAGLADLRDRRGRRSCCRRRL